MRKEPQKAQSKAQKQITMNDPRSVEERLKEVGVIVTDKWLSNRNDRLLTRNGEELGYFSPLKALDEFCGTDFAKTGKPIN